MKLCKSCGKQISNRNIYCDNKCQASFQYKTYIEKWKEGLEDGMSGQTSISSHIKKYIFEKYNSKCCKCGWNKTNPHTGNIPLEVEHVDGNHKNNLEENLKLLCPSCHSLTATYKGANRGNGREARRTK